MIPVVSAATVRARKLLLAHITQLLLVLQFMARMPNAFSPHATGRTFWMLALSAHSVCMPIWPDIKCVCWTSLLTFPLACGALSLFRFLAFLAGPCWFVLDVECRPLWSLRNSTRITGRPPASMPSVRTICPIACMRWWECRPYITFTAGRILALETNPPVAPHPLSCTACNDGKILAALWFYPTRRNKQRT